MDFVNNPQVLSTLVIAGIIRLTILILFCRTQHKTLLLVKPENRAIAPWSIWLLLLIEVGLNFIVVTGLTKSISSELKDRNFEAEEKNQALVPGLIYAALTLASILFVGLAYNVKSMQNFTTLGAVLNFSQIFFMVQYWLKITWYKRILENDEQEPGESNQLQEAE